MTVYEARHAGRKFCCDTEGSEHYKSSEIEPMDLFISKGTHEDFCLDSIVKYAIRYKTTRNLADLKKISDYSHILSGVELLKQGQKKPCLDTKPSEYVIKDRNYYVRPPMFISEKFEKSRTDITAVNNKTEQQIRAAGETNGT